MIGDDATPELMQHLHNIEDGHNRIPTSIRVGLLGQGNQEKSLLINALIGFPILPNKGGFSHITAVSSEVYYGNRYEVVVEWHSFEEIKNEILTYQNYLNEVISKEVTEERIPSLEGKFEVTKLFACLIFARRLKAV